MALLTVSAAVAAPSARLPRDSEAPHRATLHGTIRNVRGAAVPGAAVRLHWQGVELGTRSLLDGSYRLTDLPPAGDYLLRVSGRGFRSVTHGPFAIAPGELARLEVVLPPRATRLLGTLAGRVVTPDGLPAAGARVEVQAGPWDARAVTDAAGRFRMQVAPGIYSLAATLPGLAAARVASIHVRAAATARVEMQLLPPGPLPTIYGRVFGPRSALGAAVVEASSLPQPRRVFTTETGRYQMRDIAEGQREVLELRVEAPGMVPPPLQVQPLPPGETRIDFTVLRDALPGKAAVLLGYVTDVAGRALPGVLVVAHHGGITVGVVTDIRGHYVVRGLAPGAASVRAQLPGFASSEGEMHLVPGRRVRLDFIMGPSVPGPGRISGRVVDSSGAPLVGAVVEVIAGPCRRAAFSDRDGEYTLGSLPAGVYRIVARAAGFEGQATGGIPIALGQRRAVDFALRHRGASRAP